MNAKVGLFGVALMALGIAPQTIPGSAFGTGGGGGPATSLLTSAGDRIQHSDGSGSGGALVGGAAGNQQFIWTDLACRDYDYEEGPWSGARPSFIVASGCSNPTFSYLHKVEISYNESVPAGYIETGLGDIRFCPAHGCGVQIDTSGVGIAKSIAGLHFMAAGVGNAADVGLNSLNSSELCVTAGGTSCTTAGFFVDGAGTDVASAANIAATGNVFHVTGTTTITSVTIRGKGTRLTLIFDGILTFTDGSNLKLNGNFVTSADDTITLVSDGTNWFEMSRSAN